jgi:glycosyltransferase involved in cell wall biosynthesis
MKLLVFAHTPPPHHGQSYMVELMLAGLGGDHRKGKAGQASRLPSENAATSGTGATPALGFHGIDCYHVNARLSRKLEDIGDLRMSKFFLLMGYCLQAVWCRYRYGVSTLYYIPAPGKRSAVFRDWMVMVLCRPFFKRLILHWHAAGLARWLEMVVQMRTRALTYRLFKRVDLSIVLSNYNRGDAEKLFSRHIKVVPNGIPDPCMDFQSQVLPRRKARQAARSKLLAGQSLSAADLAQAGSDPRLFRVLYLAHCTRQKGLFDTLEAVALANAHLAWFNFPIRFHLTVAGEFLDAGEKQEFLERISREDLQLPFSFAPLHSRDRLPRQSEAEAGEGATQSEQSDLSAGAPRERSLTLAAPFPAAQPDRAENSWPAVDYKGFVLGDQKTAVLALSDCFCFPTYYYAESFGLVVTEAMAFGLPVISTRWRSIPELLPRNYPGLVDIRRPDQVAAALTQMLSQDSGEELRAIFLRNFNIQSHLNSLATAIRSTEQMQSVSSGPLPGPEATRA